MSSRGESNRDDIVSTKVFADNLIEDPNDGLDPEELAAIEALPKGSALLIVKRGPSDGSRFLLDVEVTTTGRHPNADIFLDDVTVSRKHAEFRRVDGGFEVIDLGSLNGTYLNGKRVDVSKLHDGDEVHVGKFKLTYFSGKGK